MSDPVLIAIVVSIPGTIASIATLFVAMINGRKVEEVHKATNSMKDALVAAALAEGKMLGIASEKLRQEDRRNNTK